MHFRIVRVASKVGLRARPASSFVKAVTAAGMPITIAKHGGDPVDARSILSVMGMSVRHGEQVVLAADGSGADEALAQLAELLESDRASAE